MSTYIPPHLRNKANKANKGNKGNKGNEGNKGNKLNYVSSEKELLTEKHENILKEEDFPEINGVNNNNNNNNNRVCSKSYVEMIEKEDTEDLASNLNENKIKLGWTMIKRDENLKIKIEESEETKNMRIYLKEQRYNKLYNKNLNKMIERWNNFRDTENFIRGDLSAFYNYKEELERIINEDLRLEEEIKEYNKLIETESYSSDSDN